MANYPNELHAANVNVCCVHGQERSTRHLGLGPQFRIPQRNRLSDDVCETNSTW